MRVLCLGGNGHMGREAVRTLLREPKVKRLTVTDLDGEAAGRFVASLADERAPPWAGHRDKAPGKPSRPTVWP
jgi:hypothetical protein